MAARRQTTNRAPRRSASDQITTATILAAVRRAGADSDAMREHNRSVGSVQPRTAAYWRPSHAAPPWLIAQHLRSRGSRLSKKYPPHDNLVVAALVREQKAGFLLRHQGRWYVSPTFRLSRRGERLLDGLELAGEYPQLPPSPNWRQWRRDHDEAHKEVMRLIRKLGRGIDAFALTLQARGKAARREAIATAMLATTEELHSALERRNKPEPPKF